jgi:hypothetical protein
MWKANGKTTTLQLFPDSLSPKLWKRLWTCRKTDQYLKLRIPLEMQEGRTEYETSENTFNAVCSRSFAAARYRSRIIDKSSKRVLAM